LSGTTWDGVLSLGLKPPSDNDKTRFELLPGGRLTYGNLLGSYKKSDGEWRQNGAAVLIQVNDCYGWYEAKLDGDWMTGEFSNETGWRRPWTARRAR
jgi:hypothetical protein